MPKSFRLADMLGMLLYCGSSYRSFLGHPLVSSTYNTKSWVEASALNGTQAALWSEMLRRVRCVGDVTYPEGSFPDYVVAEDPTYYDFGGCLVWVADVWQSKCRPLEATRFLIYLPPSPIHPLHTWAALLLHQPSYIITHSQVMFGQ